MLDKQLAQARTKTRFIRSPGLAGVLHAALSRGPNQHVRGSRRTNGGAKGEKRGGQRWREGTVMDERRDDEMGM